MVLPPLFLVLSPHGEERVFARLEPCRPRFRWRPSFETRLAPLLRMRTYAALSLALSLSSVIRPAPKACACAAASAALALPDRMCAAIVSCSVQALSR